MATHTPIEQPVRAGDLSPLAERFVLHWGEMGARWGLNRTCAQIQALLFLHADTWLPDGAVRKAWLDALGLETEPELPFQVLIDPKGMLRCQVGGAVEAKDLSALRQIVSAKK